MDIVVSCSAGLGNRLINLYTTQYIYLRHGIKFRYSWPVQGDVQVARLTDLFDYEFDECFDDYGQLQKIEVQKTDTILTRDELAKNTHWITPDARFECDSEVDYTQAFNSIPLRPDIQDKVNSLQITKNVIGLHIRGGDLKLGKGHVDDPRNYSYVGVDSFISWVDNELNKNDKQLFFSSCEDAEDKHKIKDKFGENIIQLDQCEHTRDTVQGCKDALCDLVLLSKCGTIVSMGSSFSGVASDIGKSRLDIIK